jgi:hypothetical protein
MIDRDASDRAAYEATGNPLHAWFAIGRYAVDEPLPDWTRRHLMNCTRELLRLELDTSISPTEAAERTAQALGLVSPGRNFYANERQQREDSFTATVYELGPRKGETEAWLTDLAKARGVTTRRINQIVARMRRIWGR